MGFFDNYFITRAEFDSLKNNFQSQIDQYNSSIDSKIDGAIAAYLAGIKLSNITTYDVIIKDNEKMINFMNGVYANDYVIPNMYYNLELIGRSNSVYHNENIAWAKENGSNYNTHAAGVMGATAVWSYLYMSNTNYSDTTDMIKKNVVKIKEGKEEDIKSIYWYGRSNKWNETWIVSYAKQGWHEQWLMSFDNPNYTGQKFIFEGQFKFDNPNGYLANITTTNLLSNLKINAYCNGSTTGGTIQWEDAYVRQFNNFTISLDKVDDFDSEHKNLVVYDGGVSIEVNCPDCTKTLQTSDLTTVTATTLQSELAKSTNLKMDRGWYNAARWTPNANNDITYMNTLSSSFSSDTTKIPSVGLLGYKKYNTIFRTDKNIDKSFSKSWTFNLQL